MVATFVGSARSCAKGSRRFLEKASQVDTRLAELEHPSLKKIRSFCSRRVPIYVHLSFYRSLKLDVGDLSRDSRVRTELGTGFLMHEVGLLIPRISSP